MDSSIWIALIGIIGTLAGVWLGTFLQNRNLKRQREWNLQDQKHEWIRKEKQEDYTKILLYIEGTIKLLAMLGDTLKSLSKENQENLFVELNNQLASVVPIIEGYRTKDETLVNLIDEFNQEKGKIIKVIQTTKDASKGNADDLLKIAGKIKNRINDSLVDTFNQ